MQLLILGATGRTGKWLVESALSKGHDVVCLVRDKSAIQTQHERLVLFEGTPADKTALRQAIQNCTALTNVLNISRTSDFPWSKLRTPDTFLSDVMQNIIEEAPDTLKRVILCSAWGVAETRADLPGWFRWLVDNSNIGVAYKGHEVQEQLIKISDLQWTIVRPVGLTNSKKSKPLKIQEVSSSKPSLTVSRKDVATFMVDCLDREDLIGKSLTISY